MATAKTETLKHPLVVLMVATVLGSAIVPFINGRIARQNRETELRVTYAMEALKASATTERHVNDLQSEYMVFVKNTSWADATARRELQGRLRELYAQFNRDAWWWYWELLQNAALLRLVDDGSIRSMRAAVDEYSGNLNALTLEVGPLWSLLTDRAAGTDQKLAVVEGAYARLESLRQSRQMIVSRMIEPLTR